MRSDSLPGLFWLMLRSPAAGVRQVLGENLSLRRIALALVWVGLLRGVVETLWYYLMTGQIASLPALLGQADWYWRYGGPFLVLNIPSAHFLWLTTAVILHGVGRLLGGRGSIRPILAVTGVALSSYLAIGLLNYLHLVIALPSLTLHTGSFFSPNLGIGQLLMFAWLTVVAYHSLRQVHQVPQSAAVCGAPAPILFALLLYAGSTALCFGLLARLSAIWPPGEWLHVANLAYLGATVLLTAILGLFIRPRLDARPVPDENH